MDADRLKNIEEHINKIMNEFGSFVCELSEIKSNLVFISEIIPKLTNNEHLPETGSAKHYKLFCKFIEDRLNKLTKTQAEAAVLDIVEILHKYETQSESSK